MRFSRLRIENLPERGLVGIEGPNESGKSTLGEMLLFAFFGKTRLRVDSPVASLIRWGSDTMSVEIEFSLAGADPRASGAEDPVRHFLIFRQIDRQGTNYVKVIELPERKEIAMGNVQVAEFVAQHVRFDFQEFQESFYHDQYEIRRVQTSQVAFFESASGIRHLREAIDGLQGEVEPMEREFSYYQKEIARNLSQAEKYGRNAVKLPDLSARLNDLDRLREQGSRKLSELKRRCSELRAEAAGLDDRSRRLDQLADVSITDFAPIIENLLKEEDAAIARRSLLYDGEGPSSGTGSLRNWLEKLKDFARDVLDLRRRIEVEHKVLSARLSDSTDGPVALQQKSKASLALLARRSRRNLFWTFLDFLFFLAAGALLVLRLRGQGGGFRWSEDISRRFEGVVPHIPWILGVISGLLFLLFLVRVGRGFRYRGQRRRTREDLARFSQEESRCHEDRDKLGALLDAKAIRDVRRLAAQADGSGREHLVQAVAELGSRHRDLVDGDGVVEEMLTAVAKGQRELRSRLLAEIPKVDRQIQEEESALRKFQSERDRVENEIRECQSQAAKKEALEAKNRELETSAGGVRTEMELRRLAVGLLEETISSIRGKTGPTLTRFVKSVLPPLTSGRYAEVRVESDLEIKVYSTEKNDFLSLHELSGGTNEALSLALRLAVSQALVTARMRQPQFVFLDEPFKMMDLERATSTLRTIQGLSPSLRQFFVIQPNFSEKEREIFDVLIRTARDETHLDVECGPPAGGLPAAEAAGMSPDIEGGASPSS